MEISIYLVCIVQFALLRYDPLLRVPTRKDVAAGRELVHAIAQVDGEVFIPDHGYLAVLAGKKSYAHEMAMYDILVADKGQNGTRLVDETRDAIQQKKFDMIILDSGQFLKDWFEKSDLEGYCMAEQPFFEDDSVFWPVTGMRARPQVIVYPCSR